jgi:signal transduction histidine kinase/DNA-binding NarL/FixJ family response regulator
MKIKTAHFFKKTFGIRQRIVLSFVLLLAVSFSVVIFNIWGLQDFHQRFVTYKSSSTDSNLVLKIDKNITELQRLILVFTNAEKSTTTKQISDLHESLKRDIAEIKDNQFFQEKTQKERIAQMQVAIENFSEKISALQTNYEYRAQSINRDLDAQFKRMNSEMTDLMSLTDVAKNELIRNQMWRAQMKFFSAEVFSVNYFAKHVIEFRQRVENDIVEAVSLLQQAQEKTQNQGIRSQLNNVVSHAENMKRVFRKSVQADRNYLFLVNVVIPGEMGELAILAGQLKDESLSMQSAVFQSSQKSIEFNQKLLWITSILGAIFTMGLAILTGRLISGPIMSITETFNRLAKGENLSDIPGMQRSDEIGQLAQAANVFRQMNARTRELFEQSEHYSNELKQREQLLERTIIKVEDANLAKSRFLAAMSHEIRTPMAGVIGMSELLINTKLTPQQLDWATTIKSSGQNLLTILNEILDQSKLEAGMLVIDPIDIHLYSCVEDVVLLFAPKIEEKGLSLSLEVDEALPSSIKADPLRIGQILSNFLSNALKFTHTGQIAITLAAIKDLNGAPSIRFSVVDSGIGINKETMARLFSAFVQADSSTSRNYGGTGLGLSISKQLAELMGGKIGVESIDGKGSTFWFSLPLVKASEEVAARDKRKVSDRWEASRSLRILVAEDNEVNQELITVILETLGHKVVIAQNGLNATEIVAQQDFDLILMDIRMPVMDGIEATKHIRAMATECSTIPIIALTADITTGNIKEYLEVGVNEVCSKPLVLSQLLAAIDKLLDETIHTAVTTSITAPHEGSLSHSNFSQSIPTHELGIEDNPNGLVVDFDLHLHDLKDILEQQINSGSFINKPSLQMPGVPDEKIKQIITNYEANLKNKCAELRLLVEQLIEKPEDIELKNQAKLLTHTLKGGGAVFGYHLVTTIATKADEFLKNNEKLGQAEVEFFSKQIKALSFVAENNLAGEGGKVGQLLIDALRC